MEIYPAIDIKAGRVVRLRYGDPNQQMTFGNDPPAVARRWAEAGARWLHVVNLDGAFDAGSPAAQANWSLLPSLAAIGPKVQFGGGIRRLADIERALSWGAARVVIGTAAVEQPDIVREAVARFGAARLAVGIDARDGKVKTRGWQAEGGLSAIELGRRMRELGVEIAIHTDIGRDGDLGGVNAEASAELAGETGLRVIASGGVSSLEEIRRLRGLPGVEGAIVGRALYEGKIDLGEAMKEMGADERGHTRLVP